MRLILDTRDVADYDLFLRAKRLPVYRVTGHTVDVPDEYASHLGVQLNEPAAVEYRPTRGLFDYQKDIARTAITKQKYAVFADCGLGKTLILLEFARHAAANMPKGKAVLMVAPLMVVSQTVAEAERFYKGKLPIEVVPANRLGAWLENPTSKIGITNYDALTDDLPQGQLGGLVLDESSMLKSHYGAWGQTCIRLGKGLPWKLCATGTPAPNDRIEYANHAVFLDQFPTVNSFLARFFVNRGETQNRWELKPHALKPFYRTLSHWCIFLTNPATYGWKDNCGTLPPINVHIHNVPLTGAQRSALGDSTGALFVDKIGGITTRAKLGQLAKGMHDGGEIETHKPAFIRRIVESWPTESTIIWCKYNAEQERMGREIPDAASIDGDTPLAERERIVDAFKAGTLKTIITKPKILGFGLNLQVCTRQIFSTLQDSYEEYYQAVKRSNRYGSTLPLNVHIPITELEAPMVDTVLAKARRVQKDTEEQEAIFHAAQA